MTLRSGSTTTTSPPGTPASPAPATSGSSRTSAPPTAPTSATAASPRPPPSSSAPRSASGRRSWSCASESSMRLRYAALSDVGRVRRDNQDSGYAGPNLLVIADGVGGSARGDVASATTVEVIRKLDEPPGEEMQGDMLGGLAGAIHRSHDRIAGLVAENP